MRTLHIRTDSFSTLLKITVYYRIPEKALGSGNKSLGLLLFYGQKINT